MTTNPAPESTEPSRSPASGGTFRTALASRRLDRYPATANRFWLLGLVTITTIVLYYLYFVPGGVLPLLLPYYHMSFLYFMTLIVIANAVGAFTAFIGGLSDRIGRANLTVYGLLVVGLLQAFAIPNAHSLVTFDIAYVAIGFVEGIILVVTPALVRDFSPQMGRAAAMGFWALGPVLGSLTVSQVATHVLPHLPPWQDQFMISGLVCLAMFAIAFVTLRELSPQIRDQLMVTSQERSLVEAKAKGIDVEAALAHPLRSMFKIDLAASSIAISVFLLLYYAMVTIVTLYWVIVFSKTTADANGINTWFFVFDAVGLVVMGVLSDRLRVRKPFMVAGAVTYIAVSIIFLGKAHAPHTGYYTLAILMGIMGFTSATSYSPWMANYTEAVEEKNPALAATGLAVWGWILRIIVAISFLVIPHVISSATTIVDNQGAATTLEAFQAALPYAPSTTTLTCAPKDAPASVITALNASHLPGPETFARILQGCNRTHNLLAAIGEAGGLSNPQVTGLTAYSPLAVAIQNGHPVSDQEIATKVGAHSPDLARLLMAEKKIVPAQKASPGQWQVWWWVCIAGQVLFLVLVFTMKGRWSPRAAKADFEAYEATVADEMAALGLTTD